MPNQADIEHHYNKIADKYENKWRKYNQVQIDWVVNNWPSNGEHKSILDIGCGTGNLLQSINKSHAKVELNGADLSKNMLEKAKNKLPYANFFQCNIEENHNLPKSDIITSMSVMHHIDDHDKYLNTLKNLTNKNGYIFLSAFSKDSIAMDLAERLFKIGKPIHGHSLSHDNLAAKIDNILEPEDIISDILRPDNFWMIQIYRIKL